MQQEVVNSNSVSVSGDGGLEEGKEAEGDSGGKVYFDAAKWRQEEEQDEDPMNETDIVQLNNRSDNSGSQEVDGTPKVHPSLDLVGHYHTADSQLMAGNQKGIKMMAGGISEGSDTMLEKMGLKAQKSSNWSGQDQVQIELQKSENLSNFGKFNTTNSNNPNRITGFMSHANESEQKWENFSQELFNLINRVRKEPRWVVLHLKKVGQRFKGLKLYSHTEQQKAML